MHYTIVKVDSKTLASRLLRAHVNSKAISLNRSKRHLVTNMDGCARKS